jgi:S-adenosylmethionine synthetase
MDLVVERLAGPGADGAGVEIVERKGLGHPDSICDSVAEQLSLSLSRYYLEHYGLILHHNVDKVLLWAGSARPAFGGGEVLEPFELFLAGRATLDVEGTPVPVQELAIEGTRTWLRDHLRNLDVDRHVKVHCLIRPGARELVELYLRQKDTGIWLANDTSCGVGYAPLSPLERVVQGVERRLNAAEVKDAHPEIGEDVKVMGVATTRRSETTWPALRRRPPASRVGGGSGRA